MAESEQSLVVGGDSGLQKLVFQPPCRHPHVTQTSGIFREKLLQPAVRADFKAEPSGSLRDSTTQAKAENSKNKAEFPF